MPPRARRGMGRGVARYPSPSKVRNITNLAQWNRMHKRGKNQLIFVMYTLEYVRNSHRLKTTLVELSAHSEFSDVLFAVVDIEKGKEVAEQEGITEAPTFVCYQSNSVVDKLEVRLGERESRLYVCAACAVLVVVFLQPVSAQEEEKTLSARRSSRKKRY